MPGWVSCVLAVCVAVLPTVGPFPPGTADRQAARQDRGFDDDAARHVRLTVRTSAERVRFRQDEIITLELVFEPAVGSNTTVVPGSFHRVLVQPQDGVTNPLGDFLSAFGIVGSVLGTPPGTTGGPVVVRLDLNEQWRFEQPGEYELRVQSEYAVMPASGVPSRFAAIASSVLRIQIVPAGPPPTAAELAEASPRVLRFLDTREAAMEMARRLLRAEGHGNDIGSAAFECKYGLLSTPHRAFIVAEMEQMLDTAPTAVGPGFLDTLARLAALLEHPVTPGTDLDTHLTQRRYESFRRALQRYSAAAVLAGERGTPRDRAVALASALEQAGALGPLGRGGRRDVASLRRIGAQLPALFRHLPRETQQATLAGSWRWIAGDEMLPVLRTLLQPPSAMDTRLADLALVRLVELAPDDAAGLVLEEIAEPRGRFGADALSFVLARGRLPEGELDALLASRLATFAQGSPEVAGCAPATHGCDPWLAIATATGVVERHGSEAILPDVQRVYAALPAGACRPRAALLGYILRVAPDLGELLMGEALSAGHRPCAPVVFDLLAGTSPVPALEHVAVRYLDDPDPLVAASAARALAHAGRDRGRAALWRRLEVWHRDSTDRPEVRQVPPLGPTPQEGGGLLGEALMNALLEGFHWRTTPADLRRLESLCLDDGCRHGMRARSLPHTDTTEITGHQFDTRLMFHIGMRTFGSLDALKAHLAKYPEGTVFRWTPADSISEMMEARILADLEALAARLGIVIASR